MDIEELLEIAKTQTSERFKIKLSEFVYQHPQFHNLNPQNQKMIFDIIYKHIDSIRKGLGIPESSLRQENYDLYEKRMSLGLSEKDLADIKDILGLFKE